MSEVIKTNKGLGIELPEEVISALNLKKMDAIEFEVLSEGIVALKKTSLGSEEKIVLKKLSEIKFAERTKENVARALKDEEAKVLGKLMKKGIVSFYEEGKYKGKGVYSISRDYYRTKPKESFNYLVTSDYNEIEKFSDKIRKGELVAVKGFDKKFYVVNRELVEGEGEKIKKSLVEPKEISDLSKACSVEEGLCKAIIEVLKENGEIIEKSKGRYVSV